MLWGGALGFLSPAPVIPEHQQLSQSSQSSQYGTGKEPNFCHCWLHWVGAKWPDLSCPQNSPVLVPPTGTIPSSATPEAGTAGSGTHRESPSKSGH